MKSQSLAFLTYFQGIKISLEKFSSLTFTKPKEIYSFLSLFDISFFATSKIQEKIFSLLFKTFFITASGFHLKILILANTSSQGKASFLLKP
jgi:hypothetical protein